MLTTLNFLKILLTLHITMLSSEERFDLIVSIVGISTAKLYCRYDDKRDTQIARSNKQLLSNVYFFVEKIRLHHNNTTCDCRCLQEFENTTGSNELN